MIARTIHRVINLFIAAVWLVSGLICKILNFVPRHQQIVARVLGNEHSRLLTILIGLGETLMAIWILSKLWPSFNVWIQIIIIATMNCLEFFLAPDLLLWGRLNAIFALLFIILIYTNQFYLGKKVIIAA